MFIFTKEILDAQIKKAKKETLEGVISLLKTRVWLSDDVKAIIKDLNKQIKEL